MKPNTHPYDLMKEIDECLKILKAKYPNINAPTAPVTGSINSIPLSGYIYPDGSFKTVRPYDGEMFDLPDPSGNSYTTHMWDDQSGNWIFYGQTAGSPNLGNAQPRTNLTPYTNPDGTYRSMRPAHRERFQIPHPWSPSPIIYEWDDSKDLWVDVTIYTHANPAPVGTQGLTGTYSYQVDLVKEFDKLIDESKEKACECGKDKHGFASHSDWCPKHD